MRRWLRLHFRIACSAALCAAVFVSLGWEPDLPSIGYAIIAMIVADAVRGAAN